MERRHHSLTLVTTERPLGSYLVRVPLSGGEREHVGAEGHVDGEASAPGGDDLGSRGHGR